MNLKFRPVILKLQKQVVVRFSVKKMLLEISQNSQENTSVGVTFNKYAGLRRVNILKKKLQYRCLPLNFMNFLRTAFLQNTSSGCFWNWERSCYIAPRFQVETRRHFKNITLSWLQLKGTVLSFIQIDKIKEIKK